MAKFLKIGGRSTGKGASTYVEKVSGDVEIEERNFSRTGNHWDIYVCGTGIIDLIDISNSGKHRCKRMEVSEGKIVKMILEPEYDYWDICPICK